MKEFILSQFLKIEDKITDFDLLQEYVDFCIKNSIPYEKSKTANHHILPEAKKLPFVEFKDLKKNPWNSSILSNYNHYYAHFMLAKSIKHISISHAFCAMHNKYVKIDRLSIEELISEEQFNELYSERNRLSSEYLSEIIEVDGKKLSRASYFLSLRKISNETRTEMSNRMLGLKNIVYLPGVVDKIRKTKLEKGLDKISADRAAETMKKQFIDENGDSTTIYEKTAKKISNTINEIIVIDGKETSIAKHRGEKHSSILVERGRWFMVKNIYNDTICMILPEVRVRAISPGLPKKTKIDFLGKSKYGQTYYKKISKEFLIGLYVEELPSIPQNYNPDQDYSPYL